MLAFLFTPWPREVVALAGAGVLLTSAEMASREMLGPGGLAPAGALRRAVRRQRRGRSSRGRSARVLMALGDAGVEPRQSGGAVRRDGGALEPRLERAGGDAAAAGGDRTRLAGPVLALSSTLAGNLLIVGSIANIIVVDQARRLGVAIDWRTHARVGIPITLATLIARRGVAGADWVKAEGVPKVPRVPRVPRVVPKGARGA